MVYNSKSALPWVGDNEALPANVPIEPSARSAWRSGYIAALTCSLYLPDERRDRIAVHSKPPRRCGPWQNEAMNKPS